MSTPATDQRVGSEAPAGGEAADRFVEELAPLVFALAERLHAQLLAAAAAAGVPPPLALALRQLDPARPMAMSGLAGRLGCDPSYVTGIADRLEGLGLVERRTAAHDRRIKELALTIEGEARRAVVLGSLGRTPLALEALSAAERAAVLPLLRRLVGNGQTVGYRALGAACGTDEAQAPPAAEQPNPAHEEAGTRSWRRRRGGSWA
jgi:DNA-binding MarR family transcriptional regulator